MFDYLVGINDLSWIHKNYLILGITTSSSPSSSISYHLTSAEICRSIYSIDDDNEDLGQEVMELAMIDGPFASIPMMISPSAPRLSSITRLKNILIIRRVDYGNKMFVLISLKASSDVYLYLYSENNLYQLLDQTTTSYPITELDIITTGSGFLRMIIDSQTNDLPAIYHFQPSYAHSHEIETLSISSSSQPSANTQNRNPSPYFLALVKAKYPKSLHPMIDKLYQRLSIIQELNKRLLHLHPSPFIDDSSPSSEASAVAIPIDHIRNLIMESGICYSNVITLNRTVGKALKDDDDEQQNRGIDHLLDYYTRRQQISCFHSFTRMKNMVYQISDPRLTHLISHLPSDIILEAASDKDSDDLPQKNKKLSLKDYDKNIPSRYLSFHDQKSRQKKHRHFDYWKTKVESLHQSLRPHARLSLSNMKNAVTPNQNESADGACFKQLDKVFVWKKLSLNYPVTHSSRQGYEECEKYLGSLTSTRVIPKPLVSPAMNNLTMKNSSIPDGLSLVRPPTTDAEDQEEEVIYKRKNSVSGSKNDDQSSESHHPTQESKPEANASRPTVLPISSTTTTGSNNSKLEQIRQQIFEIFQKYNPAKLSELPVLYQKYQNQEELLLEKLKKKYLPPGASAVVPAPALASTTMKSSLFPSAASQAPSLFATTSSASPSALSIGQPTTSSLFGSSPSPARPLSLAPQPTSAPIAPNSTSAISGAEIPSILNEIYRQKNPDKLAEVGSLLQKYLGKEFVLLEKICKKYGIDMQQLQAYRRGGGASQQPTTSSFGGSPSSSLFGHSPGQGQQGFGHQGAATLNPNVISHHSPAASTWTPSTSLFNRK
jgi:hypothetical protein